MSLLQLVAQALRRVGVRSRARGGAVWVAYARGRETAVLWYRRGWLLGGSGWYELSRAGVRSWLQSPETVRYLGTLTYLGDVQGARPRRPR